MTGICLDALNAHGWISRKVYGNMNLQRIRVEARDHEEFYKRFEQIRYELIPDRVALLLGPSTEDWEAVLCRLKDARANIETIILGNEPDGTGESSWQMDSRNYANLYNWGYRLAKQYFPKANVSAAGMVGDTQYLDSCWDLMGYKPDLVNVHYPNDVAIINQFEDRFHIPCIVGEWCWYTCKSVSDMYDWVQQLPEENYWFCLSNQMVPHMGIRSGSMYTKAGRMLRGALNKYR